MCVQVLARAMQCHAMRAALRPKDRRAALQGIYACLGEPFARGSHSHPLQCALLHSLALAASTMFEPLTSSSESCPSDSARQARVRACVRAEQRMHGAARAGGSGAPAMA